MYSSTIYVVQRHEDKDKCLHTVLVGLYYWITPAEEAHPLLIRSEKAQKKIANTTQTTTRRRQNGPLQEATYAKQSTGR